MVLPSCAFASPGRALIGAPLPDRFFISFGSLLYVCWLSENAALYLDCWTLFRSFQKGDAEAPRLNKKGRTAESSRCAWSGRQSRRESRQGVRGVAGRVVGRVVTVCVEWPAESSGESSRCAWSGRESRHGVSERVVAAGRCMGRRLLDRGIELRLMVQLSISSWNGAVVRFPPDSEEGHPIKC